MLDNGNNTSGNKRNLSIKIKPQKLTNQNKKYQFEVRFIIAAGLILLTLIGTSACGETTPSTTDNASVVLVTPLPTVTPLAKAQVPVPTGASSDGQPISVEGTIEQVTVGAGGNETIVGINKIQYHLPVMLVTRLGSSLQIGNQLKIEGTRFGDNSIVWTSASVFSSNPNPNLNLTSTPFSIAPGTIPVPRPSIPTPTAVPSSQPQVPPVIPADDENGKKDKGTGPEKGKGKDEAKDKGKK